jgi:hypothetical protein
LNNILRQKPLSRAAEKHIFGSDLHTKRDAMTVRLMGLLLLMLISSSYRVASFVLFPFFDSINGFKSLAVSKRMRNDFKAIEKRFQTANRQIDREASAKLSQGDNEAIAHR